MKNNWIRFIVFATILIAFEFLLIVRLCDTESLASSYGGTITANRSDIAVDVNKLERTHPGTGRQIQGPQLRIAHCITGAPRTFNFPEVYRLYKLNVIDPLEVDSDVYFVLDNRSFTPKWSISKKRGYAYPHVSEEKYSKALQYLSPKKVRWVNQVDYDYTGMNTTGANYPLLELFIKYFWCYQMLESHEMIFNFTYSHVIFTRPDVILPRPLSPARTFSNDTVISALYNEQIDLIYNGSLPDVPMSTELIRRKVGNPQDESQTGLWERQTEDVFNIFPRNLANVLIKQIRSTKIDKKRTRNGYISGDSQFHEFLRKAKMTVSYRAFVIKVRRYDSRLNWS